MWGTVHLEDDGKRTDKKKRKTLNNANNGTVVCLCFVLNANNTVWNC